VRQGRVAPTGEGGSEMRGEGPKREAIEPSDPTALGRT